MPAEDPVEPVVPPRWAVLKLARYTVPVHALLPAVLWLPSAWFTAVFFILHIAGVVLLAVSYPWWQGRVAEMVALVVVNHAVTFGVFGVVASMTAPG